MATKRTWRALGLMSGTSLDGIDAALIETDGDALLRPGAWQTTAYDEPLRERLRGTLGGRGDVLAVESAVTRAHAVAVRSLLDRAGLVPADVDVVGFHGHTIDHRPEERLTWQIGDGALLAELSGIDVVSDLRRRDVAAGGQGAPLAPLYHAALAGGLDKPVAVLNLGGVGNVTWLGADGEIAAFDTGPGCALIDDWTLRSTGKRFDEEGRLARSGKVDEAMVAGWLAHPFFAASPPKSLDRNSFDVSVERLSPADGAATLTAFTAASVARALDHLPAPPRRWLVTGGGRHNPAVMETLAAALGVAVEPVEAVGWEGDAIEAQAFAYLAVRSLRGLALTVPGTTGVSRPVTGGALHRNGGF